MGTRRIPTPSKICTGCGDEKLLEDYYNYRKAYDGKASKCKVCVTKQAAAYVKTEKGQAARRRTLHKYSKTPKAKQAARRYTESENGQKVRKRYRNKYQESGKALVASRRYRKSPEGRKKQQEGKRCYRETKKGKEALKRSSSEWNKKYPERRQAHSKLSYAIRCGRITKATECSMNDENCAGDIVAHHEDYTKPLDVVWVCRFHHLLVHDRIDLTVPLLEA